MKESRTKNTIKNIIVDFLNKVVVLIFPFIIRTILINNLGAEYLGLNSVFTSILQVLNLTELGFSSAIVFSMYKPIAKNDTDTICALMNLYKKIYKIIGIIILILGLCVMPFLHKFINGTYPAEINIYILYLIYLLNTVITYFLFAYKSALLVAHQKSNIISAVNSIICIIQYSVQIVVLCLWKNYYIYILINTVTSVLNNVIIAYIVGKKYPMYNCRGEINTDEKKKIRKRVYGLMIQKICATTRNSLDSIFLSAFLGLKIVAIYSNYYVIMNAVLSILSIITASMIASIGNSIVTESIEKNYRDMNKFNFIYMWISGWSTICLLCLYQPFMEIWMGADYMFSFDVVVCICIYFYSLKMGDILSAYTQASGIWWEGRYKAILETIFNIILNYILGKYFGVYGIILATVISLLLIGFTYGTHIVFKNYFKNVSCKEYYIRHLLYLIVTTITAIITYSVCSIVRINGLIGLLGKAIICVFIPNIIYIIFFCKNEMFRESKNFGKEILRGYKRNEI